MRYLDMSPRGLNLILRLNADRLLFPVAIGLALIAASMMASQ
ncbi:hypothetical protein [Palleronia sediminis]|nr:hypothetical protein [Palleronia sediminis]